MIQWLRIAASFETEKRGEPVLLVETAMGAPRSRQSSTHRCINLRLPTYGGIYAWEFEKGGRGSVTHRFCATGWRECTVTAIPAANRALHPVEAFQKVRCVASKDAPQNACTTH